MKIYILQDIEHEVEILSLHKTYEGARKALVEYLESQYVSFEFEEFMETDAPECETLDEYKELLLTSDRLDKSFYVEIVEQEVKD